MARDWSLSRFVRLYVVESADEAAWDWQARCVWPLLIKAADRAGVIETTKGAKGVAAVIRMPLEVVTPALDELLADGCLVSTPRGYLLRNYHEAQTAKMAASQRQAEYKARERARAALGDADCNDADAEVTRGDTGSREVTPGNAEVTPIRADPSRSELMEEERRAPAPPAPLAIGTLGNLEPVTPETKPKPVRKRPAIAMPPDFAPDDGHRTFAAEHRLDLERELDRFKLHHTAKGSVFASWSAALGTWLRNAVEFRSRGGDGPGGPRSQPRADRGQAPVSKTAQRFDGDVPL